MQQHAKRAIVLVHGAWHGGWCWRDVVSRLRAAGHEVHAPTLTGLGERAHLASHSVDLATHVQDVVAVLECEDLRDVVLVGHSYGAVVVAGVAERAASRLQQLVFLDGFIVRDGESLANVSGLPQSMIEHMRGQTDGWRLPPFALPMLGIEEPQHERFVAPRLLPHPVKCLVDVQTLRDPRAAALPRAYIQCTRRPLPILPMSAARAREAGWPFFEIATGHDAMITAPAEVAALLARLAAR